MVNKKLTTLLFKKVITIFDKHEEINPDCFPIIDGLYRPSQRNTQAN